MNFKIGDIEIKNRVVLAPMAGVSNAAYIKICAEFGAGYAVTELISAEAVVRGNKKTFDMLKGTNDINIPIGIQIFGSNEEVMAKAAKILADTYDIDFIDINMGCPVSKVATRAMAGSALLKDPDKAYNIVKAVVDEISIPVTVKIRSGWDFESINAPLIAKLCEKAGASLIAVHGRTRSQGYTGSVSLEVIRDVKAAVSIPVVGNGDIRSVEDAKKMFEVTGCDAIMIGRAAIGNPWLIRDVARYLNNDEVTYEPTLKEKIVMIKKHYNYLIKNTNVSVATVEMRMHVSHYLKGMPNSSLLKQKIFETKDYDKFNRILDDYLHEFDSVD